MFINCPIGYFVSSYFKFLPFSNRPKSGNAAIYSALSESQNLNESSLSGPTSPGGGGAGTGAGAGSRSAGAGARVPPVESLSSLEGLTDEIFTGTRSVIDLEVSIIISQKITDYLT